MVEEAQYENALALNSMLLEYRLKSVPGVGGFGMTYVAWDTHRWKSCGNSGRKCSAASRPAKR